MTVARQLPQMNIPTERHRKPRRRSDAQPSKKRNGVLLTGTSLCASAQKTKAMTANSRTIMLRARTAGLYARKRSAVHTRPAAGSRYVSVYSVVKHLKAAIRDLALRMRPSRANETRSRPHEWS